MERVRGSPGWGSVSAESHCPREHPIDAPGDTDICPKS